VLVWVIAAVFVALELALSGRYGFMQDELYFIEAGRHLAFGYADQPGAAPRGLRRLRRTLVSSHARGRAGLAVESRVRFRPHLLPITGRGSWLGGDWDVSMPSALS
jgi:hypothetical protein